MLGSESDIAKPNSGCECPRFAATLVDRQTSWMAEASSTGPAELWRTPREPRAVRPTSFAREQAANAPRKAGCFLVLGRRPSRPPLLLLSSQPASLPPAAFTGFQVLQGLQQSRQYDSPAHEPISRLITYPFLSRLNNCRYSARRGRANSGVLPRRLSSSTTIMSRSSWAMPRSETAARRVRSAELGSSGAADRPRGQILQWRQLRLALPRQLRFRPLGWPVSHTGLLRHRLPPIRPRLLRGLRRWSLASAPRLRARHSGRSPLLPLPSGCQTDRVAAKKRLTSVLVFPREKNRRQSVGWSRLTRILSSCKPASVRLIESRLATATSATPGPIEPATMVGIVLVLDNARRPAASRASQHRRLCSGSGNCCKSAHASSIPAASICRCPPSAASISHDRKPG